LDADRIIAAGAPAVQINTGGGCHLEARMIRDVLAQLSLDEVDILIIENVGNLVCPTGWDLGEDAKVVVASLPEGDDKPLKYPTIYAHVDALVISKTDLLPYIPFDMAAFQRLVRGLNPQIAIMPLSCVTDEGLDAWAAWLLQVAPKR